MNQKHVVYNRKNYKIFKKLVKRRYLKMEIKEKRQRYIKGRREKNEGIFEKRI